MRGTFLFHEQRRFIHMWIKQRLFLSYLHEVVLHFYTKWGILHQAELYYSTAVHCGWSRLMAHALVTKSTLCYQRRRKEASSLPWHSLLFLLQHKASGRTHTFTHSRGTSRRARSRRRSGGTTATGSRDREEKLQPSYSQALFSVGTFSKGVI